MFDYFLEKQKPQISWNDEKNWFLLYREVFRRCINALNRNVFWSLLNINHPHRNLHCTHKSLLSTTSPAKTSVSSHYTTPPDMTSTHMNVEVFKSDEVVLKKSCSDVVQRWWCFSIRLLWKQKTPDEHDYRQQTQLRTIMFTMCKRLLLISTTSVHLEKSYERKYYMTPQSVSEDFSTITWAKTKLAMPTDILCTAVTNVQKQWLGIFLKCCKTEHV